jgi:hypothetical protein
MPWAQLNVEGGAAYCNVQYVLRFVTRSFFLPSGSGPGGWGHLYNPFIEGCHEWIVSRCHILRTVLAALAQLRRTQLCYWKGALLLPGQ